MCVHIYIYMYIHIYIYVYINKYVYIEEGIGGGYDCQTVL